MGSALKDAAAAPKEGPEPDPDPPWVAQVAAARRGDRAAFARLHHTFARMIHGILLATVPAHDAHDLTQDVFLAALQKLGDLREDRAFGGWLAAMARSRAKDHLRVQRPQGALPEPLAPSAEAHREARDVLEAIRALPEAYRETLILRLVEGMKGPEIARETGLTEGSVRVNLHRGMKLLRERLGEEGGHG